MFKRMSVLVRRPDHDRPEFARLWERHAAPASRLPRVRGYIQNHVEATYGDGSPIEADGFVELLWDRPEDMAAAFVSEAARPMVEDEPGFLGHGSGYALAAAGPLRETPGGKLIVAVLGKGAAAWRLLEEKLTASAGVSAVSLDEVTDLIPKPGMSPPQPVDAFLHAWFDNIASADAAGHALAKGHADDALQIGLYRVRTIRFV